MALLLFTLQAVEFLKSEIFLIYRSDFCLCPFLSFHIFHIFYEVNDPCEFE